LLFERFLETELTRTAPREYEVRAQRSKTDAYSWLSNPRGWKSPQIKPDLEVRHRGRVRMIIAAPPFRWTRG
jgi:hypothetical protein